MINAVLLVVMVFAGDKLHSKTITQVEYDRCPQIAETQKITELKKAKLELGETAQTPYTKVVRAQHVCLELPKP
jgi:hypothetical protein